MDLLANLPEYPFKLYIDNFFSSLKLIDALSERNIGIVGTLRPNGFEQCQLQSIEDIEKDPKGTYNFKYDQAGKISVIRWNDNSIFTVASNLVETH